MIVDAILEHLRGALQASLIDSLPVSDDTRAGFVKIGPYQGDPTPEEGRITVSIHENDPDGIVNSGVTAMQRDWSDAMDVIEIGGAATMERQFTIRARCLLSSTREGEAATAGVRLLSLPRARFRHRQGSSVATLGYRAFLEAYDRNLARYLAKHHGRAWALAFRALVPSAALTRLLLLPLRRPERAASRGAAAAALLAVAAGSLRGWPLAAEAIERAR